MVSKELLSEVFGWHIKFVNPRVNDNEISFVDQDGEMLRLNVYQVAHKCKEWARSEDYIIMSGKSITAKAYFLAFHGSYFEAETEPEAIFKACEYILKQLSNK
jgi:hypothetical protein